jgi:hypothetical protein
MDRKNRLEQFLYIRERMQNIPINNDVFNVWSLWDIQSDEIYRFKELLKSYVNDGVKLKNKIYISSINRYLYYTIMPNIKPELILKK